MERPVVFVIWQRLQLRLSRHERREGRSGRIQLSGQGRDGGKESAQCSRWRGAWPERFLPPRRRRFPYLSVYARGTESLTDAYDLLDMTPYGRQEDFEDSPPGWPQKPTYGWVEPGMAKV